MDIEAKPRKLPRQERARVTVEAILDAATRIFAERGYAGTTTNDVATTAGISIGSLYQYYPNKDAIIADLQARHVIQVRDAVVAAITSTQTASLDDAIRAIVRAEMDVHLASPRFNRLLEFDFALFDVPAEDDPISIEMKTLLRDVFARHRSRIAVKDLDWATSVVMRTLTAHIHGMLLDAVTEIDRTRIEDAVVASCVGYLTFADNPAS
jgi:AcrR family transcriptional regulator